MVIILLFLFKYFVCILMIEIIVQLTSGNVLQIFPFSIATQEINLGRRNIIDWIKSSNPEELNNS